MSHADLPAGFMRFVLAGGVYVIARDTVAPAIREALRQGTLYEYGARHPRARRLSGRGVAYAVPLGDDPDPVVIRHNRHGGALARLTRDLFLPPTRVEHELRTSEALRLAGVPTPPVLAVAVYRAGGLLRRSDVVTREIPDAHDLSSAIMSPDAAARLRAFVATAHLVAALSRARARHHDLNVKNVLLSADGGGALHGCVLDVDRVVFGSASTRTLVDQNLARLTRSARKWRGRYGAPVTEPELAELARATRVLALSVPTPTTRS